MERDVGRGQRVGGVGGAAGSMTERKAHAKSPGNNKATKHSAARRRHPRKMERRSGQYGDPCHFPSPFPLLHSHPLALTLTLLKINAKQMKHTHVPLSQSQSTHTLTSTPAASSNSQQQQQREQQMSRIAFCAIRPPKSEAGRKNANDRRQTVIPSRGGRARGGGEVWKVVCGLWVGGGLSTLSTHRSCKGLFTLHKVQHH